MSQPVSLIPRGPAAVSAHSSGDGAIIVLSAQGTWDAALRSEMFMVLQRSFAAHPAGLIVDLTALYDAEADSVPAWVSARHAGAAMHPPVLVAFCVSPHAALADRLQRSTRADRFLPVYAKTHQALVALGGRIAKADRMVLHLQATPTAPRAARRLIDQACQTWHLPHLVFAARLVVSELVTDAVKHAGTDIGVTASRRGEHLHLIVSNNQAREHELPGSADWTPRADGLHIMKAAAEHWGVVPLSGSKMIWAIPRTF